MSDAPMRPKLTSTDLVDRLRLRYPSTAYAFFREVSDAPSSGRSRADAIAMGLWQSKGIEIEGFEIKVSRADWNRERKRPAKAESILSYCDRWWLVVADPVLVKDDELPAPWGLLAPRGDHLVAVKQAPKLDPRPLDRFFVASVLRHAQRQWSPEATAIERRDARNGGFQEGFAKGREDNKDEIDGLHAEVRRLQDLHVQFQEATGIHLPSGHFVDVGQIGEAVNLVMHAAEVLGHLEERTRGVLDAIVSARASLPKKESGS